MIEILSYEVIIDCTSGTERYMRCIIGMPVLMGFCYFDTLKAEMEYLK
jgi:hypothetical protein